MSHSSATTLPAPIVDDSVWKHWDKTGKNEFLKKVKSRLPSAAGSNVDLLDQEEIKRLVYDLFWKCLRGLLKREQVVQVVGEMVVAHLDLANLIHDIFCLIDMETACDRKEERERFVGLLKDAEKYLSEGTLKERLEIDTMGEVGILKNPKKFFSAVIKLKTKLFYKQQKFNLFREECEGYAKLITELNQDLSTVTPSEVIGVIKSIIGYFNLDPNRVLDLILEAFECQLDQSEFFIELLRLYTPDAKTLNELLGFKYKFYMNESDTGVPESLYQQTALMVQHGILDMDHIYAMLGPEDEVMRKEGEKEFQDAKDFVRSMNVLSTKEKTAADDMDVDNGTTVAQPNQKFGLLEALITVGAWKQAEMLIQKLPPYYAVTKPSIGKALQKLIHITMDPIHRDCCNKTTKSRTAVYPPLTNKMAPKPAKTFEDFQESVMPMLQTIGPYAHSDPVLLYKIIRICKAALKITLDESGKDRDRIPAPVSSSISCLYYDVITILDEVLLPALSLTECNCCLAEEIWTILRVYPYHVRYRLYGQWKSDTYTSHPQLLRKKASMQKSIKRIMQRVSKENVKQTSRQLGKLTHSSPGLLFEYILSQIQLYDNMIGPVVDTFKYLTSLSFDVLGYSIIEALNNPEKDRTKHDGTSISLWLQSLSNFCGSVYKKYNIELTGILQYVANQLKSKKSLDLLILKEIVLKMAGIEAAEEMTPEQIDAMAGGDLLRQEAGSFSQIKNTRKSSQRLKDALVDNNLAVPLCLLMAQQRNCVVYQETEGSHLKLVGKLFDQCQDTLVQFGNFLASNLSIDDYTHRLPPIQDLLSCYHVNLDLAFFLARPMFNHQISLKFDDIRRQERGSWKSKSDEERQNKYVEASEAVMLPLTEAIRPLHTSKIWDDISPQFLNTFWSLTMYDLMVPENVYAKEIAKLKAMPAKVDENKELNAARKKKEKERLNSLMEKLSDEQKKQKDHVDKVMARLKQEKDSWFFSRSAKLAKNETITTFLQLCLFPRCIFTASDAIYCAKFVHVIHILRTPNFSTLICFDRIFCDITYTVTSCTENEAHRYGRFLAAMLEIVMKWHSSKEVFEKECVGYPGFVTKFRVATPEKAGTAGGGDDHVDYENYRHVCHKWHYKIAKALVVCLESKDYVQIRNALTVLFKIIPYFPIIQNLAGVIEKRIEKVCAEEKDQRRDLYIIATSYMGQLKSRKAQMLKETDFHLTKKSSNAPTASSTPAANSDASSTPVTAVKKESPAAGGGSSSSRKSGETKVKSERSSSSRDESARSQSREKSSVDRKRSSEGRESADRKAAKKERESHSRERSASKETSKEERNSSRHSKERDRHDMGPPATATTAASSTTSSSGQRKSSEPADDRDTKRRKVDQSKERIESDSASVSQTEKSSTSKRVRKDERDHADDGNHQNGVQERASKTTRSAGGSSSRRGGTDSGSGKTSRK